MKEKILQWVLFPADSMEIMWICSKFHSIKFSFFRSLIRWWVVGSFCLFS